MPCTLKLQKKKVFRQTKNDKLKLKRTETSLFLTIIQNNPGIQTLISYYRTSKYFSFTSIAFPEQK